MPGSECVRKRCCMAVFLSVLMFLTPVPTFAAEARLQPISETILQDTKSGKMWQLERSKKFRSTDDVYDFLAELNQGEYEDWRLPTKKELAELFLLFDLREQGDLKLKFNGSYYHRNEDGDVETGSWEQGDECGPSRIYYPEKSGYVRAVRP